MHRYLLNSSIISLELRPRTGFLIKAGGKGTNLLHPERPDLYALRTLDPAGRECVFIPGSSLKGVFRSASERILRGLLPRDWERVACDPMDHKGPCQTVADEVFRGSRGRSPSFREKARVYRGQCYACRSFSSMSLSSRIKFQDSLPTRESRVRANRTSTRSGVAIDRKTGGPANKALYKQEVVTGGSFPVRIHLENVQLWQLALLGAVIEDISLGITRLGSSKTRGLGAFKVDLESVQWRQQGGGDAPRGVGDLLGEETAGLHGMVPSDALDHLPGSAEPLSSGIWTGWIWKGDAGWALLHAVQEGPWASLARQAGGGS